MSFFRKIFSDLHQTLLQIIITKCSGNACLPYLLLRKVLTVRQKPPAHLLILRDFLRPLSIQRPLEANPVLQLYHHRNQLVTAEMILQLPESQEIADRMIEYFKENNLGVEEVDHYVG